jgi:hypothetical protein
MARVSEVTIIVKFMSLSVHIMYAMCNLQPKLQHSYQPAVHSIGRR